MITVTSLFQSISQVWPLLVNNTGDEEENSIKSLPSLKQALKAQDTSKRPTQAVQ